MLRLKKTEDAKALYAHMRRDFPAGELPPLPAVRKNVARGVYEALWIVEDETLVGYAVLTAPPGLGYALLHFFAVLPAFRGGGFGSRALECILERLNGRVLVLEVEAPDAAKNEKQRILRERRVKFYERAGLRLIPTQRARIFGVDMLIMMNGETHSVRATMHALYLPTFRSERWLRFIDVRDSEPGALRAAERPL